MVAEALVRFENPTISQIYNSMNGLTDQIPISLSKT